MVIISHINEIYTIFEKIVVIIHYNCESIAISTGEQMFIKRGGNEKIVSVLDEEELTDEQKKAARDLSKQVIKQSDSNTDTSNMKKSGR